MKTFSSSQPAKNGIWKDPRSGRLVRCEFPARTINGVVFGLCKSTRMACHLTTDGPSYRMSHRAQFLHWTEWKADPPRGVRLNKWLSYCIFCWIRSCPFSVLVNFSWKCAQCAGMRTLCCPCLQKWFAFSCSFYFQYFVCTNLWLLNKSNKIFRSTLFKWLIVSIVNDSTWMAPVSECRSFMDHGS